MMMKKISFRGYRFPPEIIRQAIWLYLRPNNSWGADISRSRRGNVTKPSGSFCLVALRLWFGEGYRRDRLLRQSTWANSPVRLTEASSEGASCVDTYRFNDFYALSRRWRCGPTPNNGWR
jgi:hypothetical protein